MKKTGAQIIVTLLEMHGIKIVSGIPGGSILPLYDELYKSSIKHVLVRQEQAAGFAAQGMARTTGKPAVCLATSGPGAMNLLTAIADARSDSVPIIAITGQVNTSLIGTDAFQEADTFGLSFPITKHSVMVKSPEELLTTIPRAFQIAMSGRQGPVLIDVPRNVQTAECEFDAWPEFPHADDFPIKFRTKEQELNPLIRQFCSTLIYAKKPVLYVGGGCNSPEVAEMISKFLKVYEIPVVTSLMGIAAVSNSYKANLGMVGMHGLYAADCAMHDSDVVFTVGARFDDRAIGLAEKFCPDAKILHIDIDAAEVNKIFDADLAIVAKIEHVLPELTKYLSDSIEADSQNKSFLDEYIKARQEWLFSMISLRKDDKNVNLGRNAECSLSNPRTFLANLPVYAEKGGVKKENLIISTDVGQHQMWTAQYYPFEKPRTLLTSGSLGTMGFGLPTAIGAALVNADKRIICISGDGSLLMNIQELATLAEENLSVTIIVLDNGVLGMVRQQQKYLMNKDYSASEFSAKPDFCRLAEAFGIRSVDANNDSEWYKKAFTEENGIKPCLVHLSIDPEEDVLPFVMAGKANKEAFRG